MNGCDKQCKFTHDTTREHLLRHVESGIPTKITYAQLDLLPARDDFCKGPVATAVAADVAARRPLLFMPNAVTDRTMQIDGVWRYVIYMFGVLPCGSKTCIRIDDAPVVLEVKVPDGECDMFKSKLNMRLISAKISFTRIEMIERFPLRGFHQTPCGYIRIHFDTLKDRDLASRFLEESGFDTAADDAKNKYFNKIARDARFATADWNVISGYEPIVETAPTPRYKPRNGVAPLWNPSVRGCKYVLRIKLAGIAKLGKKARTGSVVSPAYARAVENDPTMVAMWDIETYSTVQNGLVPTPSDHNFCIFMICSAYFWHWTDRSMLRVCCVDVACDAREGIDIVIECGTEKGVLLAHAKILGQMMPDILGAFNGSKFDWPLYKEKLTRCGELRTLWNDLSAMPGRAQTDADVAKWNFGREYVKIDAENTATLDCVAMFPGVIDTDVQVVFKKIYPRSEIGRFGSLNFFLAKNGLASKEDMPYKRMFKIYEVAQRLAMSRSITCHCTNAGGCEVCAVRGVGQCCYCASTQSRVDMAEVAYYCIIDCVRPQQLFCKRCIVMDKREVATLSLTSLYDAFYRADSMKVLNFIGSYCTKYGIAFSNKNHFGEKPKDSYVGGWVFPPRRGLNNRRPITGLDFASLYVSLMMAFNHSPDMVVKDPAMAEALRAAGYSLYPVSFEYTSGELCGPATCSGWNVRHNGIHNPRRDTHIVDKYIKYIVMSCGGTSEHPPHTVKWIATDGPSEAASATMAGCRAAGAKLIRRTSYEPQRGRAVLPGERMGIFALVVKKLFDKRAPIKVELGTLQRLCEKMDKEGAEEGFLPDGSRISHVDAAFRFNKADAKSRALKLLGNTIYGTAGQSGSPVNEVQVSGGICWSGRYCIKLAAEYVRGQGFEVHYGDTDSLYISCPDSVFAEADTEWAASGGDAAAKIKYWTKMVELTMQRMNGLKEEILDMLLADNGTMFLSMAYEEVGFPTVLCGKKKYFFTPHIEQVNFYPKDLFVRGLDMIKQGQSQLNKILSDKFMRLALQPSNERGLLDIAIEVLKEAYAERHEVGLFVLSAKYKPDKKNVPVQTFVQRMREMRDMYRELGNDEMAALYDPPEAGDPFTYVMVTKDTEFTPRGNRIILKKGARMEYLRVYQASQSGASPMRIDLAYYMTAVLSTFARFVCGEDCFQPGADYDPERDYTAFDSYCTSEAGKYLERACEEFAGPRVDLTAIGRTYRSSYGAITKTARGTLACNYGGAAYLLRGLDLGASDPFAVAASLAAGASKAKQLMEQIDALANELSSGVDSGKALVRQSLPLMNVFALRRSYNPVRGFNMARRRIELCKREEDACREQLLATLDKVARVMATRECKMIDVIMSARSGTGSAETALLGILPEEDAAALLGVYKLVVRFIAVRKLYAGVMDCISAVTTAASSVVDGTMAPSALPRDMAAADAQAAPIMPEYVWN